MFISKLNTAMHQHGKWFFGFLSVALVVSLGYGLSGNSCASQNSKRGKSFEQDFTQTDLWKIDRYVQIMGAVSTGRLGNSNYDDSRYISFLARERAADKLGIFVTDDELKSFLKNFPQYATNGKFDGKKFHDFTKTLKKSGISGKDVDAALKFVIKIEKVSSLFAANIPMIASDDQLKVFYDYLYGKYEVTSYTFDNKNYAQDVNTEEKNIVAYFNDNKDKYPQPKLVSFDYAVFNFRSFANDVKDAITEKSMKGYYEKNKERFVKDPTATKDKTEYKTFEEVKKEIQNTLFKQKCKAKAVDAALQFVTELFQEADTAQDKRLEIFAKLAKNSKLDVISERKVRVDGENYKGKAPQALLKTVDDTNIDASYAAEVVDGVGDDDGKYYVAVVDEKIAAGEAEKYTDLPIDIQEKIKADYILSVSLKLAREDATNVYNAVSNNKEFDKKTSKVSIENMKPFTLMSLIMSRDPKVSLASNLAVPTKQGAISELNANANFGAIFVKVNKREKPDMKNFEKQKPMLRAYSQSLDGASAFGRGMSLGDLILGDWVEENSVLFKQEKK
ncbi:hypothetical protein AAEX28_08375 [Lentisphaerota bacterium WC36G]|nr:SurA N-terminal domain-containing protein [Lentisphaerae bacterium WC36]